MGRRVSLTAAAVTGRRGPQHWWGTAIDFGADLLIFFDVDSMSRETASAALSGCLIRDQQQMIEPIIAER